MAGAIIELTSRADGVAVRLLDAGGPMLTEVLAEALVPAALRDAGDPRWSGPAGLPWSVATLTPDAMRTVLAGAGAAIAIGHYLHALALPPPVRAAWVAWRAGPHGDVAGAGTLLAVRPAVDGAPDLRELPWELLCDPDDGDLFRFRDQRHPLALRTGALSAVAPAAVAVSAPRWPLRMLVLVGTTDAAIGSQEELLAIELAIAEFSLRVELSVEHPPWSVAKVMQALTRTQPHLLHFIGHGTAPTPAGDGGAEDGALLFSDGAGEIPWPRHAIRAALTALPEPPRLVVLNACEGAAAGAGPGTAAIAAAFADLGCPAVIAMRDEITGEPAAAFSGAFYRALADAGIDRPDVAYARALNAIAATPLRGASAWCLPRLWVRERVADVFPGLGDARGFRHGATGFDDLAAIKPFVDREAERGRLCQAGGGWLDPTAPVNNLLFVKGKKEVGKSWFVKSVVYLAGLRGFRTLYWDFAQAPPGATASPGTERRYELEDVLRALRAGLPKEFFKRPPWPPPPAPNPFDPASAAPAVNPFEELDGLLADGASANPGAGAVASRAGDEDTKALKAKAFVSGLAGVARQQPGRPVLLALDHPQWIVPEVWTRYLLPHLVLPLATQPAAGVRLVIAGTPAELDRLGLGPLAAVETILEPLPGERFAELFQRFLLHFVTGADDPRVPTIQRMAAANAEGIGGNTWEPKVLSILANAYALG